MPWPATLTGSPSTGIASASGVTTIRWGTEGLLQSPKPSKGYYTVTRFNQRPLVDAVKLPNGNGVSSTRILIKDGVEFTITVRDDTSMTPPAIGANISIVDAAGLLGTVGLVYSAKVLDSNYDASPKAPGERNIHAENLVLIDSQSGSGQV